MDLKGFIDIDFQNLAIISSNVLYSFRKSEQNCKNIFCSEFINVLAVGKNFLMRLIYSLYEFISNLKASYLVSVKRLIMYFNKEIKWKTLRDKPKISLTQFYNIFGQKKIINLRKSRKTIFVAIFLYFFTGNFHEKMQVYSK